eukprot:4432134-Amphidinium_carterae.1
MYAVIEVSTIGPELHDSWGPGCCHSFSPRFFIVCRVWESQGIRIQLKPPGAPDFGGEANRAC